MVAHWLNIKEKIANFDIKPARPVIADLLQKVDVALEEKNILLADRILHKLLAINDTNYNTLTKAIDVNIKLGRVRQATRLLKHAIKYYPEVEHLHGLLGFLYSKQGNLHASAKAYKQALTLCPQSTNHKHFFDAASRNNTAIAPREYVIDLFDTYAETFEHSLVDKLRYKAHIELPAFIYSLCEKPATIGKAIDMGCGTGLLGQELLRHFNIQHLAGVDLSTKMLEHCQAKNIYQSLHNADLLDYLRAIEPGIDLIVCTDVLIYLGDLSSVFEQCYRVLTPGGYFGFSVEKLWWGDFKLTTTGRYQHSLQYLKSLYKRYQFSKMYSQTIDLRTESGNMVKGYLVLLQK